MTRWGTWLSAAIYYSINLESIERLFDNLTADESSVKFVKEVLSHSDIRQELAFIAAQFSELPAYIAKLEGNKRTLADSLVLFDKITGNLQNISGTIGKLIKVICEKVIEANEGLKTLRAIVNFSAGLEEHNLVNTDLISHQIASFKKAPVISAEAERSFSIFKHLLSDRRQCITIENLKNLIYTL